MVTRRSAYENGGTFENDDLLWYAKGVRALQERVIDDRTSWSFLAAIHGIDRNLWIDLGYLSASDQLPPQSERDTFWNQCQHGTWYFIPWHRGYLQSLEAMVRDAIISEGGPTDWALPYWNYSDEENPEALFLPPAFTEQTMPDGSPNPLYVEGRQGPFPMPENDVRLKRTLELEEFTGALLSGFGGGETEFNHGSGPTGGLENKPHNFVHVDIGGVMGDPNTAALDPIFYLHHANIDRLWEVWLNRDPNHENPIDSEWLTGPADRAFIMPTPDGEAREFTAQDVESTEELGYEYDDTSDPLEGLSARDARLQKLGRSPSGSGNLMGKKRRAELIGANSQQITLLGTSASTQVQLDRHVMQQTKNSFAAFQAFDPDVDQPDRIHLNIENIRADLDGQVLDIYINLPSGADPDSHPELHAGSIALFGVKKASDPNQPHGGMGVTHVLEITDIVDALHLDGKLGNLSNLEVSVHSRSHLTPAHNVTVERISVYRQNN